VSVSHGDTSLTIEIEVTGNVNGYAVGAEVVNVYCLTKTVNNVSGEGSGSRSALELVVRIELVLFTELTAGNNGLISYGELNIRSCSKSNNLELESYKSLSALDFNFVVCVSSDAYNTCSNVLAISVKLGGIAAGKGECGVTTSNIVSSEGLECAGSGVELITNELEYISIVVYREVETPNLNALEGVESYSYIYGSTGDVGFSVGGEIDLKTSSGNLGFLFNLDNLKANRTVGVGVSYGSVVSRSTANLEISSVLVVSRGLNSGSRIDYLYPSTAFVLTVVEGVTFSGAGRSNGLAHNNLMEFSSVTDYLVTVNTSSVLKCNVVSAALFKLLASDVVVCTGSGYEVSDVLVTTDEAEVTNVAILVVAVSGVGVSGVIHDLASPFCRAVLSFAVRVLSYLISSLVVCAIYIADNGGNSIFLNVPGLEGVCINNNFTFSEELSVLSLLEGLTSCTVSDLRITVVVTVKNYAGVEDLPGVCLVSGELIYRSLSVCICKDLTATINGTLVVGNRVDTVTSSDNYRNEGCRVRIGNELCCSDGNILTLFVESDHAVAGSAEAVGLETGLGTSSSLAGDNDGSFSIHSRNVTYSRSGNINGLSALGAEVNTVTCGSAAGSTVAAGNKSEVAIAMILVSFYDAFEPNLGRGRIIRVNVALNLSASATEFTSHGTDTVVVTSVGTYEELSNVSRAVVLESSLNILVSGELGKNDNIYILTYLTGLHDRTGRSAGCLDSGSLAEGVTLRSDLAIGYVVTILTLLHNNEAGSTVGLAATDDLSSGEGVRALELGKRNDAYDRTNYLCGAALSIVVNGNVCIYLTGSIIIVVSTGSGLSVSTLGIVVTVSNGITISTASGRIGLGLKIVAKRIGYVILVSTTNLTYLVKDSVGLTSCLGFLYIIPSMTILSDILLTNLTILVVVALINNLNGMILVVISYVAVAELLNLVSSLVVLGNEAELTVLNAGNLSVIIEDSLREVSRLSLVSGGPLNEGTAVYASIDSVLTSAGASNLGGLCLKNELACSICIVECSLSGVVLLAIALSVDGNFLGCAALLSGTSEESKTGCLSGGLGDDFGHLPTFVLANSSTLGVEGTFTYGTDVCSLAADTGNIYEVMELCERNSLFLLFAANGTLIVTKAILTFGAGGELGVLVIFIKNPFMITSSNDVAEELFAALGTLKNSVAGSFAICFFCRNNYSVAVCYCVCCGAGSINGNCRKRRRRYERQNHDRCQHKRKNLFHVFFPFEK